MSESVRGVVVAHSSLAAGLVAAVRKIAGVEEEALVALSNEERSPEDMLAAIEEAAGTAPVILFTDLGSGSCAFAARKLALRRNATGVVCGANLPLLLDFVFHRDTPLPQLVDRLIEKGRGGIIGACTVEAAHADRVATS